MAFTLTPKKSTVELTSQGTICLTLEALKFIKDEELPEISVTNYPVEPQVKRTPVRLTKIAHGWQANCLGQPGYRHWRMVFNPKALIFPTREGEYISNPEKLPLYHTYFLSYPGTASTKCVIIFFAGDTGVLIGGRPSLNWAKISLTRGANGTFRLKFLQKESDLFLIPFTKSWEEAVSHFRKIIYRNKDKPKQHQILSQPRYFLQMGVRDFFGKTDLKSFLDLLPLIKQYREALGLENIVHLFATNASGFDQMFPDFSIDPRLGGEKGLAKLVDKIHGLDLYVSHHFNPRIADYRWLQQNPQFKDAVVVNPHGAYNTPWVEFYKGSVYFVLDPNHPLVQQYSRDTIRSFQNMGFDYVEIDQIAYQRNLYTPDGGFGLGYQKLIEQTTKLGMKFWVEGVSDVFDLPADCYYQILHRDRSQMWETEENRRGYPCGTAFTRFFRTLRPHAPISFQLVTEKGKVGLIAKRMRTAKSLNVNVYDLEMGFVDTTYPKRLVKTLQVVKHLQTK